MEEPVGYSPRGRKESDTTERLHFYFHFRTSVVVISSVKNAYLWGSTFFCHFLHVSIQTSLYGEVFTGHTLFKTTTPSSLYSICPFPIVFFLSS